MNGCVTGLLCIALVALLTAVERREARRTGESENKAMHVYWIGVCTAIVIVVAVGLRQGVAMGARIAPALAAGSVSAHSDAATGYIFDRVLLIANAIGAAVALLEGECRAAALGAAIAAALPLTLFLVSRGRGIGFGDVKLAATLGSAQTPIGALWTVLLACGAAGMLAVILMLVGRRTRRDTIAFGPFLTLGACLAIAGGGIS